MDVVKIEGTLYAVMRMDSSEGTTLEPLALVLARNILVDEDGVPTTLAEVLVRSGWIAPWHISDLREALAEIPSAPAESILIENQYAKRSRAL